MADDIQVRLDDDGVVWVSIVGRDGRPLTATMQLEEAEALGQKLVIAVRHFRQRTGRH